MFEPIGGSAPKYTGLGVVNPLAAIGAAQLMLDQLGAAKAAAAWRRRLEDRRQRHAEHGRGQDGPVHQPGGRQGGPIRGGIDLNQPLAVSRQQLALRKYVWKSIFADS